MVFNDISDTEGFKLYVDGIQIGFIADGTSGTPGLHSQGLTIGGQKHDTNNAGHAECSITNFAVFTGDKTGNAVAHYNNGNGTGAKVENTVILSILFKYLRLF